MVNRNFWIKIHLSAWTSNDRLAEGNTSNRKERSLTQPDGLGLLKLTKELFGEKGNFVRGEEASILASGIVTPIPGAPWFANRAKIKLTNGIDLDATSFRLKAPIVRADLWNSECWRVQMIGLKWGDAFEEDGTGWGATMPNESPFFRIDRIFKSSGIHVVQARTERTKSSDHRALVVDMVVQ